MSTEFKPAPELLKRRIHEFMERNRGRLYHRIPHPEFDGLPTAHGDERFDIIKPHLDHPGGTVLDVGAHWGQMAHWLEDLGYEVTAVEHAPKHAFIARGVRDICGKSFEVKETSIFDLNDVEYDIVLALNIFHHFLKAEDTYNKFVDLLHRLECKTMFFEAHVETEKQMKEAYRNMGPEEFTEFVRVTGGFANVEPIGKDGRRQLYKLTHEPAR